MQHASRIHLEKKSQKKSKSDIYDSLINAEGKQ